MKRKRWFFDPFKSGNIWGFERSTLFAGGEGGPKYMDRWIVYLAGYTVRLHKFWTGDDDRAPHDHPWPFITFPFVTYEEDVPNKHGTRVRKTVKGWRFHFRPAEYRHIVKGRPNRYAGAVYVRAPHVGDITGASYIEDKRPFYTVVLTGRRQRTWGFWPRVDKFIDWRLW